MVEFNARSLAKVAVCAAAPALMLNIVPADVAKVPHHVVDAPTRSTNRE
jgi:hypothetical protein